FQHWLGLKTSTYCDLYEGRAEAAHERILGAWARIEASNLLRLQFLRIFALRIRAGTALALAAARPGDRRRLLELAEQDARKLEREGTTIADAAASLILAGAAAQRGRHGDAIAQLGKAIAGYD